MREILASINKKKHVKLGHKSFSPLMELSAGIVLNYCDNLNESKKVPLLLCFPQKKGAALWTSIITLTNAFLDDYIDNVVEGREYKSGDKVSIYGCICKINRVSKEFIILEYKDQTLTIQARDNFSIKNLLTKMSKVPMSRALNKRAKYTEGLKKAKINRNTISKILIPNDPEIINQKNLDSKVLLIAGRGNVKSFHSLLDETVLYEEKLSKTFGLDKNLIIKPDLKPYIDFFKDEIKLKYTKFKQALNKFSGLENESKNKSKISSFLNRLEKEDDISIDFENNFLSFVEEYDGEFEEQLKFVMDKFPGVQESLPSKLKAVILNDISQLNEYPETIKGFLSLKIPVVVTSNRNVSNVSDLEFYDNLFNTNPEYYRINWNRKKIEGLIEFDTGLNFIDEELWKQSRRYASQQIKINITEGCELDVIIGQLLNEIKELDEFEVLQKAFYKYFYPALYVLKNSKEKTAEVTRLISEFKIVFEGVKGGGLAATTINLIEKGIKIAYDFESNTKVYNPEHKIFSNNLPILDLNNLYIPSDTSKKNLPTSNKSKLIFTGYPYQEYSGKFLLNSVCVDFIPEIEILCWPYEGSLTINYLTRRLKAGYFTDNIDKNLKFPSKYLLKEKTAFISEIDSFFNSDSSIEKDDNQEQDLSYLHTFKYRGFNNTEGGDNAFKVKCNILNFKDGSFMFLPVNSSILAELESDGNRIKIKNTKFSELSRGLKIFKYKKDRSLYKEIGQNTIDLKIAYNQLEIWRDKLELISNKCDGNIGEIKKILTDAQKKFNLFDAKPSYVNLRNWLFDDDMIMPDIENVKLIMTAADGKVEYLDDVMDKLQDSFKFAKVHRIQLAHRIKKEIVKQVVSSDEIQDGEIVIILEGVSITIEVKTIDYLDGHNVEIDYSHTRKILC